VTILVIMAAVIGAGISGKKLPHVTEEADPAVEEGLAAAR